MRSRFGPWFNDASAGSGGSGGGGGAAPSAEELARRDAAAIALAARYGDATKALGVVLGENFEYRERERKIRENPAQLIPAEGLADGRRLMSKQDAEDLVAYRALNPKPAELKTALDKGNEAVAGLENVEFEKLVTKAAKAADWKDTVLTKLVRDEKLKLELRSENVTTDGKTEAVEVAYVRGPGANDPWAKLTEYVEKHAVLKDFIPALKAKDASSNGNQDDSSATRWPAQSGGSGSGPQKKDAVAAHVAGTYKFPGKENAAAAK